MTTVWTGVIKKRREKGSNLIENENIYGAEDAEEPCDVKPFGSMSEAGTSASETLQGFHDSPSPPRKRRRTSRRLKTPASRTQKKDDDDDDDNRKCESGKTGDPWAQKYAFECWNCGKKFNDRKVHSQHTRTCEERELECKLCGSKFP